MCNVMIWHSVRYPVAPNFLVPRCCQAGWDAMKDDAKGAVLAGTLERGMRILALFADHHTPLGISEIARLTGLEKSAAHRLTRTLLATGYLDRDETTRRYRPGLRMLDMAFAYLVPDLTNLARTVSSSVATR